MAAFRSIPTGCIGAGRSALGFLVAAGACLVLLWWAKDDYDQARSGSHVVHKWQYRVRILYQQVLGPLLTGLTLLVAVWSVPHVYQFIFTKVGGALSAGLSSSLLGVVGAVYQFIAGRDKKSTSSDILHAAHPDHLRAAGVRHPAGGLFDRAGGRGPSACRCSGIDIPLLAIIGFAGVFAGFIVNANYIGIGRMYRDRLMELFMPDKEAIRDNQWRRAGNADQFDLAKLGRRRRQSAAADAPRQLQRGDGGRAPGPVPRPRRRQLRAQPAVQRQQRHGVDRDQQARRRALHAGHRRGVFGRRGESARRRRGPWHHAQPAGVAVAVADQRAPRLLDPQSARVAGAEELAQVVSAEPAGARHPPGAVRQRHHGKCVLHRADRRRALRQHRPVRADPPPREDHRAVAGQPGSRLLDGRSRQRHPARARGFRRAHPLHQRDLSTRRHAAGGARRGRQARLGARHHQVSGHGRAGHPAVPAGVADRRHERRHRVLLAAQRRLPESNYRRPVLRRGTARGLPRARHGASRRPPSGR